MYGILITEKTSLKATRHLKAMYECAARAGIDAELMREYRECDVLMLYGLGGSDRLPVAEAHRALGKPFIAWDLPYWHRETTPRFFRLSFNGNHPADVMHGSYPGPDRFQRAGLRVDSVARDSGPIMLVGNGPKSCAVGADGWAKKRSIDIRKAFPGKEIIYRPKPRRPHEPGVHYDRISSGDIDDALKGVSLVVCRHSNVAVDACRLGVPVVCDDGAAACIYPQKLKDYRVQPSPELRKEFLHRLAYWQWSADEAVEAWAFIEKNL